MLVAPVNGQKDLEEPQEWLVVWEEGLQPCIVPGMKADNHDGTRVPKGHKIKVLAHYIPAGASPSQELWGLVVDDSGTTFWVALVINTQPRAVFIEPEIKNEFHISGKFTDGRWKLSMYGYHKNIPFVFDW